MRPTLYLDVDDTLLDFSRDAWLDVDSRMIVHPDAIVAAKGAGELVRFAAAHFNVVWLTAWAPNGTMHFDAINRLSRALDVSANILASFNGAAWGFNDKTDGIEKDADWWWLEDEILASEKSTLRAWGKLDRWIPCHATKHRDACILAMARLREIASHD